jgi:hypothetical protein
VGEAGERDEEKKSEAGHCRGVFSRCRPGVEYVEFSSGGSSADSKWYSTSSRRAILSVIRNEEVKGGNGDKSK